MTEVLASYADNHLDTYIKSTHCTPETYTVLYLNYLNKAIEK